MEDLAKIKERIAKLLAMAGDSSSPNEAAIAAGRARSLMDKYQVSEYDVTERPEEDFATLPAFDKFYGQLEMFRSYLSVAVAQYNDCIAKYEYKYIITHRKTQVLAKRVSLMGFKTDVELARQMYGRLEEAITRLAYEWFKETGTPYSHRLRRNFSDAAASVITDRLKAITKERDTITHVGAGTSLMVIKAALVAEKFGEVEYKSAPARGKIDHKGVEAILAGRAKGALVEIVPVVTQ